MGFPIDPERRQAVEFYICDLRPEWQRKPYVTVWRPNNANYAYPLAWAGLYSREQVEDGGVYYYRPRYATKRAMDRFPVPRAVVEALAVEPRPGIIDGNVGPVIPNTKEVRAKLRAAAYRPNSATDEIIKSIREPWRKPRQWAKAANGSRPRVFCASLADVFDNQVPGAWRADLFALIRATPELDWLLLKAQGRQVGAPLFMTPERVAEASKRIAAGESIGQIAADWGISRQTLYVRFNHAKVKRLRRKSR